MGGQLRGRPNSRYGFIRQSIWVVFNASAMLALAACGGGGGGGDDPPAPPVTNPPPSNTAPTVSAGADQTIVLPANSAELSGSATDAENNTLTYAWTSAPADGVTFSAPAAAATTVTFPAAAATYTLTLTVSDGTASSTDTLVVTVQAAGGGTTPSVTAGDDQTITLPTNQVQLAGSATDPEGEALTYAWTASPAGVTFGDAAAASTTATFANAGTFTLTLTASDGQTTGSDSLTVVVNAAAGTVFWPGPDDDEADPDRGWLRATPEEAQMDLAKMQEAEAYAVSGGVAGQTIDGAGMIVRGGRLVHSWAIGNTVGQNPVPASIDARFAAQSATKSIGGIALLLAMEDRGVTLADLATSRHPSIGNPPGTDDPARLGAITVGQLATHTAGFPKTSGYAPLAFDPGTTWSYSDGSLNWLADLLTNVFQEDLHVLLTREVWAPLGINNGNPANTDDIVWRPNSPRADPPPGSPPVEHRELASGMSINVNAMARVGLLFLRDGQWESGPVLSETYVTIARTPVEANATLPIQNEAEFPGATTNYGVLWWTNDKSLLPHVPKDAYWAWGQGDSLIVVIPSLDLVISRIGRILGAAPGRAWGETDWTGQYEVLAPFLNPIVCAADAASSACNP